MLKSIIDIIFSAGTAFGIFFIVLGLIVFLKTIEKIAILWYQNRQRTSKNAHRSSLIKQP